MLCAFSPNMGKGTNNMMAIEPPSILTDNVSLFAFYDRIYVDGRSFAYICGEYETKFFDALIKAGLVEVKEGLYDEGDVQRCQTVFAAVFNADFSQIFNGTTIDFADAEPREFERRLRQIDREVCAGYYLQLKNYCALKASAQLGCPIIGLHETDRTIQREILSVAKEGDVLHDAVLNDPFARSFGALKAALDFEIEDFPLSVNLRGKRAEAMSAINQEVAPEKWPQWYAERRIDPIESGRRLKAFLRMREAPHFKSAQSHLGNIGKRNAPEPQIWLEALKRDCTEISKSSLRH